MSESEIQDLKNEIEILRKLVFYFLQIILTKNNRKIGSSTYPPSFRVLRR